MPRLRNILTARRKRKEMELREMGTIMAVAFHEPGKLPTLFKPHIEDTLRKAKANPDEWEHDQWWTAES